jgi:hypothetical protein
MEQSLQLGATFAICLGLLELVKYSISLLGKKKVNGATEVLQKIQGNDLLHINDAICEQNTILRHHTEILVRIATLLEIGNKK